MHIVDINLESLTKVEGSAALDVRVKDGKVEYAHFKTLENKRFYTEAMKGKPLLALPQLLARICGTCSNAHLMCNLEACEDALGITVSEQTQILRRLTMNGLMIRDHALHLYLFVMPDLFGKDAFLDFDEHDAKEHQMLHDGFDIKAAGNLLSIAVAGRSVHATNPTVGGFLRFPDADNLKEVAKKLEEIRPAILRLITVFTEAPFHFKRQANYMALLPDSEFGFLGGSIHDSSGQVIPKKEFKSHLEHVVMPYSQASGYSYKGASYLVGALARLNLAADRLHPKTRASAEAALKLFPSQDVYLSNLAQAIEILHCVDESLDILEKADFKPEPLVKAPFREAEGIGVIEAPRGTLYHKIVLGADGIVRDGDIVVPTGQNQINIEQDIAQLVTELLGKKTPKEQIVFEMEKLIRAYDPCLSCAAHFLKVNWQEG